jgi:hypothetical protein
MGWFPEIDKKAMPEEASGGDGVADQVELDSIGIPASLIAGPCLVGAETSST